MGKDWLHWIVGGGGGGGGSSARRGRRTSSGKMEESAAAAATSAGCMCAVFQLFDLHHFQFPQPNSAAADFHEEATTSKGAEAPRNSLEEPTAAINAASSKSSLPIKEEEEEEEEASLNFPMGIQIKTNKGRKAPPPPASSSSPRISISCPKSRTEDFSLSECSSNSPGTKTPSLVARLMGLDLLPECTSPSLSSSSSTKRKNSKSNRSSKSRAFFDDDISGGARSLPETPRVSSSRRSDVELYHHRLSLQINKENPSDEYFAVSEKPAARRGRRVTTMQQQDENVMSPGQYAKQIAKHVRESASRRVGLDITNTSRSIREQHYRRDDENLILLKPTKKISTDVKDSNRASSCSPRLRFLDTDKNKPNANSTAKSPRVSATSSSDNHSHNHHFHQLQQQQQQKEKDNTNVSNAGKCSSSRLKKLLPHQASDHTIRNKKEETFVHSTNKVNSTEKKSKRTPLSSDILNISSPTLLQIKRDPSPPPTKLPLKQVSDAPSSKRSTQLSSKPSHSYNQPNKILRVLPDSINGSATTIRGGAATEYRGYIQIILERADIINNRLTWYTPLHPIDPSIFHHVELFHPTTTSSAAAFAIGNSILSHRCNRKLIFQLVNELLGEIRRPRFVFRPSSISLIGEDDQFGLVDELCKKIDDFPQANCLVLEDIDSLIEEDLRKSQLNVVFEEEEKERMVCEIEDEIMEMLVRETVAEIGGGAAEEQRLTDVTW